MLSRDSDPGSLLVANCEQILAFMGLRPTRVVGAEVGKSLAERIRAVMSEGWSEW